MPKIAVCGKGGVGKTTFAALLAYILTEGGNDVYAIDADPNPTLAEALGLPENTIDKLSPITEMKKLIAERTGAKPGEYGSYFKLNPRVSDIPERFSITHRNIHFLMMGTVRGAGKGCACPENSMLKALVTHLLLREKDSVILDMVAGTEHLGRGTAGSVDAMVIVIEPGLRSIKAAHNIAGLAGDLGVSKLWAVANRLRNENDKDFIINKLQDIQIAGFLPYSGKVLEAERNGTALYDIAPELVNRVREITEIIL